MVMPVALISAILILPTNPLVRLNLCTSNLYALDWGRLGSITPNNFSSTLNFGTNTKSSYPLPFPTDIVVGTNFQYLLDKTIIPTPIVETVTKTGCGKATIHLSVPAGATPGIYHMEGVIEFQINPLRIITIKFNTEDFQIIK